MNDDSHEIAIGVDFDDSDSDSDSDHQSKYYTHTIEAMKTKTGLDIGYKVFWPKRNFCKPQQPESYTPSSDTIVHPSCNLLNGSNTSPSDDHEDRGDSDNDDDGECVVLELSTQLPSDCIAPMFHGTQWAGTTIWRSAVVALQYLMYHNNDRGSDLAVTTSRISSDGGIQLDPTVTVLELGCGLGVPGMVLHAMTGCRTILTDKDDLLPQLQRNISSNFYNTANDTGLPIDETEPPDQSTSIERRIEAQALDWSIDGVHEMLERCTKTPSSIDVILACDCIYEPLYGDSWRNLLNVQNELLRQYPQAYVVTACHRRPCDGIDSYIAEARQQAHISHLEQLHIPFAHSSVVELYRLHGRV